MTRPLARISDSNADLVSPGGSRAAGPTAAGKLRWPLRVEVVVPVSMFGQIVTGQRAIVRPESAIGGRYESTVKIVDPVINAASGTFRVRLELDNSDNSIPAGIACAVSFEGVDGG